MATARNAGHLIRFDRIHQRSMDRIFFEAASTRVAVQALAVVVASGNFDLCWWRTHVLHVDPRYASKLVSQWAVDGVVSVAGVTSHVRRHSMILKVLGGNPFGIVDI